MAASRYRVLAILGVRRRGEKEVWSLRDRGGVANLRLNSWPDVRVGFAASWPEALVSRIFGGVGRRRLPRTPWSASLLDLTPQSKRSDGPPRLLRALLIPTPSAKAPENERAMLLGPKRHGVAASGTRVSLTGMANYALNQSFPTSVYAQSTTPEKPRRRWGGD